MSRPATFRWCSSHEHRDMEAPDKGHPRQGSRPPKSSTAGPTTTRVTAPHPSGQ